MPSNTQQRLQSKRRLVPSDKRKRALFSCDRCKLRKTKCKRLQNNDLKFDNITPCIQCSKAGVACTTSIPRKKRFYGPVKNIALHYKCLLALITGLFPDSDIYNIEELIDIGHKLKFEMPSIEDTNDENMDNSEKVSFQELERANKNIDINQQNLDSTNFNNIDNNTEMKEKIKQEPKEDLDKREESSEIKTTTGTKVDDLEKENGGLNVEQPQSKSNELPELPPSVKIRNNNIDSERLIVDKFGHTHFIGNFGTASLLNGLCDIIIKRSYNETKPPTSTQDIRDTVCSVQTITSENDPVYQYPTHLYNLDTINVDRFPLINIVDRNEADIYLEVFFEKVHPYYFIFNQESFIERYEIFWEELDLNYLKENKKSQTVSRLSSAEICSIYTIWILGRRFQQYSNPEKLPENSVLDEEMIAKFIDIIKLSLSDVVLTPSIDGIRLLILFSVYLSSIKIRESGYCLMELAAIQAKSLGLHRKSIVNKFNDKKSDVMKRILWSLTKAETTLCCSFGRSSAIPWEEIDIGFPDIPDEKDENFKIYYLESCKLTKIIFEILDYKKKTQRDPLSLVSIEKALYFKNKLETFWNDLPTSWKDYKSLPIKRYKPKLHIQYHYYFITLTLPMFLYIVNSQNYIVKNDDPFLSLFVCGIKSSFKTAEMVSYTDAKGFFNGTLYYDVFYCYNAIMVLTLSYILFKSSNSRKQIVDLDNLNKEYDINLEEILKSINLIRKLVMNNLDKIDGTMKRMSDIIETLLEDLGIIQTLVEKYNAPASNVKKIEDKFNSVTSSIPSGYKRLKLNLNKTDSSKRKRSKTPPATKINGTDNVDGGFTNKILNKGKGAISHTLRRAQSHPIETLNDGSHHQQRQQQQQQQQQQQPQQQQYFRNNNNNNNNNSDNNTFVPMVKSFTTTGNVIADRESNDFAGLTMNLETTPNTPSSLFTQMGYIPEFTEISNNTNNNINTDTGNIRTTDTGSTNESRTNTTDINDVLNSMSLNTDLMDALFGSDLFNIQDADSFF